MKPSFAVTVASLLLSFLSLAPAAAQDADVAEPETAVGTPGVSVDELLPPAIIGSGVGLVGGALLGAITEIGGGDDPGLLGAMIFGLAGSALGTGLGIHLGSDREVPRSVAFATGAVGILAGVAFGAGLAQAFDVQGLFIGYVVGQGTVSAALSAWACAGSPDSLAPESCVK